MDDLRRVQRVTSNFFFWQGLRWVPFGFAGLATAVSLARPDWWPLPAPWEDAALLLILLAAFAGYMVADSYYKRTFGEVSEAPGAHRTRGLVKWLVAYPLMGASLGMDAHFAFPVLTSGLVWGAALVAYWWSTGQGRSHHLLGAAVLAGLTFLPLLGLIGPGKPAVTLFLGLLGVIYIVGGILDHLELVRMLPAIRGDRR